MLILAFPDYLDQARALATALGCPCEAVELHRFPDGESRVRLPAVMPEQVVFCRSLDHPNDKLVELMIAAATARELGARDLTLVAPYLCYMRQDIAFSPGEAVSQLIIGRFLADLFNTLVTVDPHLHRITHLEEAVPNARAVVLTATAAMGEFLRARSTRPLVVGPDRESAQWVGQVAAAAGLDFVVADKVRHGDHQVAVSLPPCNYAGRDIVLVDDLASTGRTLAVAARELIESGARRIDALVTHPLFVGDAEAELARAGIGEIFSSDSIVHPSNAFSLAPLLAAALG
jgi:ribose-phosphate pyrophosphokinase